MSRVFTFFLLLSVFLLFFGQFHAEAADGPDIRKQAVELFMDNKPVEAIPLLKNALQQYPDDPDLYMYLATSYEQMENYEAALQTCRDALSKVQGKKASFHYNMGNIYQKMKEYEKAVESYDRTIALDPNFESAYLNRANVLVRNLKYDDALADYRLYLSLDPKTAQKENIEKMISLLSEKIVTAEKARLEEEKRRREEEQRRQELLKQVLNSLEESGEETKNISAGTGEVKEYDQNFDIID